MTACWGSHFPLRREYLYKPLPGSPGYGDKVLRVIGAADPGAVPGGSTKNCGFPLLLMGPN